MDTWYCIECGEYFFSEPKTKKDTDSRLQQCSLCGTMSIVPLHQMDRELPFDDDGTLEAFANRTRQEFPNLTFDDLRPAYRPLNYLIQGLNRTKRFIHVATESIDPFFIGMLAMKYYESNIEIHIVVWHPQKIYEDLRRLMAHSVFIKEYQRGSRTFARGIVVETVSEAHQKLIVLDGRIAFFGSANATLDGWSRDGELVKFTTDMKEIQDLNRNFFSTFVCKKRNLGQNRQHRNG